MYVGTVSYHDISNLFLLELLDNNVSSYYLVLKKRNDFIDLDRDKIILKENESGYISSFGEIKLLQQLSTDIIDELGIKNYYELEYIRNVVTKVVDEKNNRISTNEVKKLNKVKN